MTKIIGFCSPQSRIRVFIIFALVFVTFLEPAPFRDGAGFFAYSFIEIGYLVGIGCFERHQFVVADLVEDFLALVLLP